MIFTYSAARDRPWTKQDHHGWHKPARLLCVAQDVPLLTGQDAASSGASEVVDATGIDGADQHISLGAQA
jgi:hypothetical protein